MAGDAFKAELRTWAFLAAASLAVAGVFAALLAISRIPGSQNYVSWPLEFFSKGLVIHVVFSLVVWFLAVFALLASLATADVAGHSMRWPGLGRAGLALVAMAFPLLFLPAFREDSVPTLNNYIPVIIHPGYYAGLIVLALGILAPVVRLFGNVARLRDKPGALTVAMTAGGAVYTAALSAFAIGTALSWGEAPSRIMHEHLFWGGGHLLQFVYFILMLACWYVLGTRSLGPDFVDQRELRLAVGIVGLFAVPSVLFYVITEPFSADQAELFRRLQFVLAVPALLIAGAGVRSMLRHRAGGGLPWQDPAFFALALSFLVFGIGGVMGFVVTGTDTRTPAHYHGVIAGVNLAVMGLMLTYILPLLDRAPSPATRLRLQIGLYGFGQLLASAGLFMAGGYGAPRKTPSGAVDLTSGATAGMALHGVGALLAVAGGILVVATLLVSLGRSNRPQS